MTIEFVNVFCFVIFQTVVFYAISVIQKERRRRESIEENNIRSINRLIAIIKLVNK